MGGQGLVAARKPRAAFWESRTKRMRRDLAQRFGAAGYFRKPVDDQALLDAISWALNRQPGAAGGKP
jgi:DNA-binding NarL/FixJ family response regulator